MNYIWIVYIILILVIINMVLISLNISDNLKDRFGEKKVFY